MELGEIIGQHLGATPGVRCKWSRLLEMRPRFGKLLELRRDGRFVLWRASKDSGLAAMLQEMRQRVLIRLSFEIALNVELRVEVRRRVASLAIANVNIVLKRIDAGGSHVLVGFKIK